jgi:hypothetical protein
MLVMEELKMHSGVVGYIGGSAMLSEQPHIYVIP